LKDSVDWVIPKKKSAHPDGWVSGNVFRRGVKGYVNPGRRGGGFNLKKVFSRDYFLHVLHHNFCNNNRNM